MNELQMKYEPILINFRIPKHLKYHLDRLVKFKGISRTSVLIHLIEGWIQDESKQLENDGRVHELMSQLENTIERSVLRQVSPQSYDHDWGTSCQNEPPFPIFHSNDDDQLIGHDTWR